MIEPADRCQKKPIIYNKEHTTDLHRRAVVVATPVLRNTEKGIITQVITDFSIFS